MISQKQFITCSVILTFCMLCISATGQAQTQLGADIDGEVIGDQSGTSVSLSSDGSRLAIGSIRNDGDGPGDGYGHVRVYQWSDSTWVQLGADIDGEEAEIYSGASVSLSSDGNRLAIGAPFANVNDSGHVRVYQWSGTAWVQLGADIDGKATNDNSGNSVALSSDGNRLAIGANWSSANGYSSGQVSVYQWSGATWAQLGADINGEAPEDRAGAAISLSSDGNRLAIGASANDGNGKDSGHVRVYQWSGVDWTQLGADIDGDATNDNSGSSVSLSSDGNRLAIGAPFANEPITVQSIGPPTTKGGMNGTGLVRIYQWSGAAWVQVGADIDGEATSDYSGWSVSLSSDGNRLAIGAPYANANDSGHVRVYQWSGTAWAQLGADIDGEALEDLSGEHISLSSDGNRVAIAAELNDGNGDRSGHVRVYDLSMFNTFKINPGLNDAWYNSETDGQGFFITVFPDLGAVSLAWFTYDTELPPVDATANLGDPGHRWLTAVGPIVDNQALMEIELTSGGLFDSVSEITRTDPPGSDGTIILTFDNCNSGTIEYDIPSINRQGIVPIRRVANDNIVICEALNAD